MYKYVVLAASLFAGAAHAGMAPVVLSDTYTATITYNGGSASLSQPNELSSPLANVATQFKTVMPAIQSGINSAVINLEAGTGATFEGGTLLSNTATLTLKPNSTGVVFATLSGITYQATTNYSGTKLGVIDYNCTNTLTVSNFSATAQWGTGSTAPTVSPGLSGTPSSSTNCDSDLSWLLPGVGSEVLNIADSKINSALVSGVTGAMASAKNYLFFDADQNYLVGLDNLVPPGTMIVLPNGQSFAIGQYVNSNLAYLIANSQMSMTIGQGAVLPNNTAGTATTITGTVLNIAVTAPNMSFSINLTETIDLKWVYNCTGTSPTCTTSKE